MAGMADDLGREVNEYQRRRQMNAKRHAASLLLGALLAACASTPASPTPAGSSQPTPSATPPLSPSPAAVASATARPNPSPSPTIVASGLPAGWHHALICGEDGTGCQLQLYDVAEREQPGWPVALAGGCRPQNLAVGTDGIAHVACRIDDERVLFNAFDVGGATVPGWPIRATGYPLRVEVGRDGTAYFGTVNEAGDGALSIHAFAPDGHPRVGWPRALPRTAEFTLAPDGTVVGWWYEDLRPDTLDTQAARTKFTMIGPNGQTLPGRWPVTSISTATAPVMTKDGSIFYTSETGRVWGHDRTGGILDGWPHRLTYRVPPELRPDGRLMFILGAFEYGDGNTSEPEVIVLTTGGKMASGWPYQTSASLKGVQCCTDCYPYFPHAVSADGTLYLAPWTEDGTQIGALDGRGQVVTGWPYRLPPGSRVVELEMGSAGRLVVSLRDCSVQQGCCNEDATRKITLTPAGELAP
jgi:hypothetical protein